MVNSKAIDDKEYVVYVLRSETSGKIYIGQTNDLKRRLFQHNDPSDRFSLYTKRNPGPWKVAYSEKYATRSGVMVRERELKSGGGRELIKKLLLNRFLI